jgi:hypothetical protein
MNRRVALVAVVALAAHLASAALSPLAAQVGLLLPALASPSDVIKVIDALTRNDSSTTVDVKLGQTVSQGKLLVARTKVDVAMDRSSKNWRGRVKVHMCVPTEVTWSIDLCKIRPEHIRLDPMKGLLIVKMPSPCVEDVTPMLTAVKADNSYHACRFKFCDKTTSRELENAMLLHDYQARARQLGESEAPQVREQGRAKLQELLQNLLQGSARGVRVVVE